MKRKSRFWTFILSFMPGLGHCYIGFATRGAIFFCGMVVACIATGVFSEIFHQGGIISILIPVVWLASLIDSMILVDKINKSAAMQSIEGGECVQKIEFDYLDKQNKKIIAMLLSVIPGAGHMFWGLQKQGLELMSIFFFTFFFTDWLNISLFMFIIPIIWFYSVFDMLQKISSKEPGEDGDVIFITWLGMKSDWFKNRDKVIGYGLVIIGLILIAEKIVLPEIEQLISWQVKNYIETGIVALVFIFGGIRILIGSGGQINGEKGEIGQ